MRRLWMCLSAFTLPANLSRTILLWEGSDECVPPARPPADRWELLADRWELDGNSGHLHFLLLSCFFGSIVVIIVIIVGGVVQFGRWRLLDSYIDCCNITWCYCWRRAWCKCKGMIDNIATAQYQQCYQLHRAQRGWSLHFQFLWHLVIIVVVFNFLELLCLGCTCRRNLFTFEWILSQLLQSDWMTLLACSATLLLDSPDLLLILIYQR